MTFVSSTPYGISFHEDLGSAMNEFGEHMKCAKDELDPGDLASSYPFVGHVDAVLETRPDQQKCLLGDAHGNPMFSLPFFRIEKDWPGDASIWRRSASTDSARFAWVGLSGADKTMSGLHESFVSAVLQAQFEASVLSGEVDDRYIVCSVLASWSTQNGGGVFLATERSDSAGVLQTFSDREPLPTKEG